MAQLLSRFAFLSVLSAVVLVGPSPTLAGEARVRCFGENNDQCRVFFEEPTEITHLMAMNLEALVDSGKRLDSLFIRESPGGDVYAAMRIGRLLRAQSSSFDTHKCASACVLIAAGAVERSDPEDGLYGLHRPYGTRPSNSAGEAQETYRRINADIESYLREMNVQPSLLGAMNVVPPESVRWITADETTAFGLTRIDPAYSEFLQGQLAKRLGISRKELLRLLQRREVECDPLPQFSDARYKCLQRLGLISK